MSTINATNIVADALVGNTSATSITVRGEGSATTVLNQGLSKAWINHSGTGTIAIRDSFNIASIVDNATGTYTQNSTNAMGNNDFTCVFNAGNGGGGGDDTTNPGNAFSSSHVNTTSQTCMETMNDTASNIDRDYIGGVWHGDLA
tara:strand:- start:30 stop:464 length:435 start_codon:yes stop_codon:yes gene_type:complete